MNSEPAWLRAQRLEERKFRNRAAASGILTAAVPLLISPMLLLPRTTVGMACASVYFAVATILLALVAKRYTSRGSVLRYLTIWLAVVAGIMSAVAALFAPTL